MELRAEIVRVGHHPGIHLRDLFTTLAVPALPLTVEVLHTGHQYLRGALRFPHARHVRSRRLKALVAQEALFTLASKISFQARQLPSAEPPAPRCACLDAGVQRRGRVPALQRAAGTWLEQVLAAEPVGVQQLVPTA